MRMSGYLVQGGFVPVEAGRWFDGGRSLEQSGGEEQRKGVDMGNGARDQGSAAGLGMVEKGENKALEGSAGMLPSPIPPHP